MPYAKRVLRVALLLSCANCTGEASQPQGCPVVCGPGMLCDPVTHACVPDQTVPPPQQCPYRNGQCGGVCVDLSADPENCGVCGNRCGPNASCIGGACVCATNTANCNNNWFDGCECVGACSGAQCATPPPAGTTCKADTPGSCPDAPRSYCDGQGSCLPCPQGYTNCDGVWGCECAGLCQGQQCAGGSGQCDPAQANSCGGDTSVCSASARECVNCPTSLFNCDGVYGCECENPCAGTACGSPPPKPCDPQNAGACGEAGFFCDAGTCKACPAGKQNCDAIDDCETTGECPPAPPVPACTYEGPDACGKDQSKWCYQGQCRDCSPGFFNCDSTRGCECDKGCDGTDCAPDCTYEGTGECYPNTLWCYQEKCISCTPGFYNCDGTKGCECQNGCIGTACAPAPPQCTYEGTGGCAGETQWCYENQCTNCSPGFYNCDGTRGCECEIGCDGAACAAPPPQCAETSPGDCGPDTTAWCYLGQCVTCTPGFFNCDGVAGCECQVGCNGTACACSYDQIDPCGGAPAKWCYEGQCTSCTAGFFNCDLTQGCECEIGCDGTACAAAPQCAAAVPDDCGSDTQWCYQGQCTSCTAGFYNCDGINGCECQHGCDGTACGCSASIANDCGSTTQWCYQNKCTSCTTGFYNCDGVDGCECDSGCDGAACGCSASVANDCGSVTQWCYQNKCTGCTAGFLNCDGVDGCECGTGNKTSWCYQGGCSSCSAGFYNCDGIDGCECSGGCSGSTCL